MVEYLDANGMPQEIATLSDLSGAQMGDTFTVTWDASAAFNALIDTGDVMVHAVATNKLQLTDAEPMTHTIKLDPGVHPPDVLEVKLMKRLSRVVTQIVAHRKGQSLLTHTRNR